MAKTPANPWALVGGRFDTPVSPDDALKIRGMDFKIEKHPLKVNGFDVVVPDHMATIRMDKMIPLGVVGSGYEVRDYVESFRDTVADICREGNATIESAGMFGNGERGFIQAKLPDDSTVEGTNGKDTIGKYLTVLTSHDGSIPLVILETAIRIICRNTFNAAFKDKTGFRMTVKHTSSMDERIKAVRAALAHSNSTYAALMEKVNAMASKGMTEETVKTFLHTLFPDNKDREKNTRTDNIRKEIANLYANGVGQDIDGVKGTLWAMYNGVTEYVDYYRGTRGQNETERNSNRLESLLIGSGATVKNDAFDLAVKMLA